MKKSVRKFLEFNGRAIYFVHADGQYWVAIRPIVEALNIEYAWQLKQVKKHPIWGQLWSKTTMVDRKNALRKMVALPEKYVYMWIAQLPIKTEGHLQYVKECVDLLYDHFHGSITGRQEVLARKAEIRLERKELLKELRENDVFIKLQELDQEEMRGGKVLKKLDADLLTKQLSFFQS